MFKFYDLLKIIDTTNINFHETFIILRVIEELLEKRPDYNKTINLLIKLPLTKSIKLNMIPIENYITWTNKTQSRYLFETDTLFQKSIGAFIHSMYI